MPFRAAVEIAESGSIMLLAEQGIHLSSRAAEFALTGIISIHASTRRTTHPAPFARQRITQCIFIVGLRQQVKLAQGAGFGPHYQHKRPISSRPTKVATISTFIIAERVLKIHFRRNSACSSRPSLLFALGFLLQPDLSSTVFQTQSIQHVPKHPTLSLIHI